MKWRWNFVHIYACFYPLFVMGYTRLYAILALSFRINFVRNATLTAVLFLACKWDIIKKLLYIFICCGSLVKNIVSNFIYNFVDGINSIWLHRPHFLLLIMSHTYLKVTNNNYHTSTDFLYGTTRSCSGDCEGSLLSSEMWWCVVLLD